GYLFFGEATDVWTWIGALVIFTSAGYVIQREAHLQAQRGTVKPRDAADPLCLTPVTLRF
ncbi:MAG TPA: hypothetical protein VE665_03385, partial [Hyphomicrobiaceae bacterium]|nr:hypothetical protein [Hyphomicrobiaceae bacterium]